MYISLLFYLSSLVWKVVFLLLLYISVVLFFCMFVSWFGMHVKARIPSCMFLCLCSRASPDTRKKHKIYIANNAMRKYDRSLQYFLNLYIYKEIKKSGLTSCYKSSFCTLYACIRIGSGISRIGMNPLEWYILNPSKVEVSVGAEARHTKTFRRFFLFPREAS